MFFRGGKVRLIQLLDNLSAASPESGLFFDWSRNKRYLQELSHDWLLVWQCDFLSKKSCELMASDEASEENALLSSLNASLESFDHETIKDKQIECFYRIVCHGRYVLAVLPTGFGKSAMCCFIWAVQLTPHQKHRCLFFFWLTKRNGTSTK